MYIKLNELEIFLNAICDKNKINGYTHNFYRYPARFSPLFVRSAIKLFTKPGDLVLDPFMGGGTTLVESRLLGRTSIGIDINELACFVANVKTTIYSKNDINYMKNWIINIKRKLPNIYNKVDINVDDHYLKNINTPQTWRIKNLIAAIINEIEKIEKISINKFARCALLNTGQWALDCKTNIPSINAFISKYIDNFNSMIYGATQFSTNAINVNPLYSKEVKNKTLCINRSIIGIENDKRIIENKKPKLIITSPPYPGVHIVYNRWQINGRKETPALYWISNTLDGKGASYYTLGHRNQKDLVDYYNNIFYAFNSISKIIDKKTIIVQMIAFSEPTWQLPKYLEVMKSAGFNEIDLFEKKNRPNNRLWRKVPHRKWYTSLNNNTKSNQEVILFHQLNSNFRQ
ncbi:MAG: hypothetical protein JW807_03705 [Spirochaetes bacterium]|nr:hypothetical protein [Spirochaetota bacterium]